MLNFKLGTPKELSTSLRSALQTAKQAQDQMRESIKAIRAQIADLKAQREALARLAVTEEVAAERVREWFEQVIRSSLTVNLTAEGVYQGRPPMMDEFAKSINSVGRNSATWEAPDPVVNLPALIAIYLRDEILAGMLSKLSDAYAAGLQNIDEAARSQKLNELDQQILDFELAEESIIRAAIRSGVSIERRADASSAVVEASDAELP